MIAPSEFQHYLQRICSCSDYKQWWKHGVLTNIEREQSEPFDFDLHIKEVKLQQDRGTSSEKSRDLDPPLPVIQALHQYVANTNHVLLVGRPGAGKTKTLIRYLLKLAKQALDDPSAKIPILVQLKDYNVPSDDYSGIVHLIRKDLKSWRLFLELEEIERYLFQERIFLLLVDGLNELSASQEAQKDLRQFRDSCRKGQIPIVFVTRSLGYRDLGVETQLEIQPISAADRQRFIEKRVSAGNRQKLQGWLNRARQADYTPFVMWMLATVCQQVNSSSQLESFSLGEAFREFVRLYEDKLYEDGKISEEDCEKWSSRLEHLASEMMTDERAENFVIPRVTAIEIIGSEALLNNLVRHHLLVERQGKSEIEFCHQLLQEYYVAEWLRRRLPDFLKDDNSGKKFQHYYLNYLKWTEPIAIMFGLQEITENQAKQLINLTLEVDLKLGARLAGEVKPEEFQKKTVSMIAGQEISEWFRIFLLGDTKSPKAADELMKALEYPDPAIRRKSVWASRRLGSEAAMPLILRAMEDSDPNVRETAIRVIGELGDEQAVLLLPQILTKEPIASVREAVARVMGKLDSEAAILALLRATQDTDRNVSRVTIYYLEEMNPEILIPTLTKALKNIDVSIRRDAAKLLGKLGDEKIIFSLFEAQLDLNPEVHSQASHALDKVRKRAKAKESDLTRQQEVKRKQQIDMWLGHINSEEPIRRGNAIHSLTSLLGKEVAIPLATQSLDDPHHYVRGHSITALVRLIGKEAIPLAIRALDDPHYHVRNNAAQALASLKQKLPNGIKINEETVFKLIQVLNEDQNAHIRSLTITTLTNLCSIESNLLLREDLELALINASYSSDNSLRSEAARGLKKFSSERVSSRLLEMVGDSDFSVALSATEALKNMPYQITMKYLSTLTKLNLNSTESFALEAISAIQSYCGFYNYEIYQQAQDVDKLGFENHFIRNFYENLDKVISQIQENPELRQSDKEDRLTIDIVNQLRILGYEASHDSKIGGHVDIVVRKNDCLWLGEAKIYRGNNYLWEGFQQLATRYSSGDYNQENGGLLIYIREEDASSIMESWQNYLLEKSLPNYSFRPCKMRNLVFISTHKHERSGQAFHVRHIPVMLHFAPKDKSGRRREESP